MNFVIYDALAKIKASTHFESIYILRTYIVTDMDSKAATISSGSKNRLISNTFFS